jgi:hypothetical protein
MLAALAEYIEYEAQPRGATPAVRATFFPYLWPNGVNAGGEFAHCAYVAPDRIQADYEGFTGGEWISEVLTANLQVSESPAVITYQWNYPGFTGLLYYRAAETAALLAVAGWTPIESGDTIQIRNFYQFKLTLEGYRAWAVDDPGDANGFTAYAVDVAGVEAEEGYAAEDHVPGDPLTYIEASELMGEFPVVRDIETAGSVSMEAPKDFSDLVAGSYSGLTLNNRQKAPSLAGWFTGEWFVDGWFGESIPAPLFSPGKSSFFLAQQIAAYASPAEFWKQANIQLKIELGWSKGGWFVNGFGVGGWLAEDFTDFVTLFIGKVREWGPVTRAVGSPNTAEVYAEDSVSDCLKKRVCLPAADGSPNPLTFGEFLCKAEAVAGWSPDPVIKSAYFESNDYSELHSKAGTYSLITPGLTADRAFRVETPGVAILESSYGTIRLDSPGEMFVSGSMRFHTIPANIASNNMVFMQFLTEAGLVITNVTVQFTGNLFAGFNSGPSEDGKFNIKAFEDVPVTFAVWGFPGDATHGKFRLWINGEEVITYNGVFEIPIEFRFGPMTGAIAAEAWTIDFDDLEVKPKYYHNAFKVDGSPFTGIGPVYIDDIAQPDEFVGVSSTETLIRYPAWGMVQITSADPEYKPSGDVQVRVIENAGGRHALYVIEQLLAAAGLTENIDAPALAAAYAACPDDVINARFEGGGDKKKNFGLADKSSMGVTVADCLKEILSRMMYWFFIDAGRIKIMPYTGAALTDPVLALTASNKWENSQTIDLQNINAFVTAIYGWYERNPSLFYVAGTQEAGGEGVGLDYSWDSPVCCERRDVVKAKADLLLQFLSAQDLIDPVSMSLSGARLELMTDVVSLRDELLNDTAQNYVIRSKEVNLDRGSRGTTLRLMRILGE